MSPLNLGGKGKTSAKTPKERKTSPRKKPLTFEKFSTYLMSRATKTGSNSYAIGELRFRRSGLKNIYLIIQELKEAKLL